MTTQSCVVRSILVLDDEETLLSDYTRALKPRVILATTDSMKAAQLLRTAQPDLVLVDLWLGESPMDVASSNARRRRSFLWGVDVVHELRQDNPASIIVLITGGYSQAYDQLARKAGADGVLPKHFGPEKIVAIVEAGMLGSEPTHDGPMSLARNEYEYLTQVYVDNDCNVARTARDLAVCRGTLYRKLRELAPRR